MPLIKLAKAPPLRPSWKWANEVRKLPPEAAEPGPFNSRRAPWAIGLSEAMDKPSTDEVTAIMGRQMSKTETILNHIGKTFDDDPRPTLYVGPTQKNVESVSTSRVKKMIEQTPELFNHLLGGRADKVSEKFIKGVRLGFGWGGSATEVASHPAAQAYIDEYDRMPPIPGEGDVRGILLESISTYDGFIYVNSTPLKGMVVRQVNEETGLDHWSVGKEDDISSPTWLLWQEGTRHEWAFPCTECNEYFIPWSGLLNYDEEASLADIFKNTRITCPHCGSLLENKLKEKMNNHGVFVAPGQKIKPCKWKGDHATINKIKVPFGSYLDSQPISHPTFWVSGLCTNWRSYGHRARVFTAAKRSGEKDRQQTAINTGFGELYKEKGTSPEWAALYGLREGYQKGEVPDEVKVLTCGVDVQKKSLYWSVNGWGPGWSRWTIDYGQIFGETKYPAIWDDLQEVLQETWGKNQKIKLMLIDASYKPNDGPAEQSIIYDFCCKNQWAFPARGRDTMTRTHYSNNISVNFRGKPLKGGLQMWQLDSDHFKTFNYEHLEWEGESSSGIWHLPGNTEDEYLKQITAETRIVLANGKPSWETLRNDNHWGDCEMMNAGAAHILNLNRLQKDGSSAKPKTRSRQVSRGIA